MTVERDRRGDGKLSRYGEHDVGERFGLESIEFELD